MSVQLEQYRVVGVKRSTGEDVSVVIEAASKAAAEVKAEQQNIETTHIVRLKQADELPPDAYELFSADAAEALSSRRTEHLIENIATAVPDEPAPPPRPEPPRPEPVPSRKPAPMPEIVAAITRPVYTAPAMRREPEYNSPFSAFAFVLFVIAGLAGGAYYVLIHEPNALIADQHELVFGDDLYIAAPTSASGKPANAPRDAFDNRTSTQQTQTSTNNQPLNPPANLPRQPSNDVSALVLQSVVTSHEGRFAVINGKLYKEGSELAGCKLLKVADDWVLMERLGEQFVLEIESNDSPNQR